jgi:predicted Zn-dependent peptidase
MVCKSSAFGQVAPARRESGCDRYTIAPLDPEAMRLSQLHLGIVYGGTFDPIIMLSTPGPVGSSPDFVPFMLLSDVLTARDAGSAQALRHIGATYGIHFSLNQRFPGLTLLEAQGQVEPDKAQYALRQMIEDIRGVSDTITAEQLEEAKRRRRTDYLGALSNPLAIAAAALAQIRRGRAPSELLQWPAELMGVSLDQCRAVARRWLAEAQPSVAVAGLPVKLLRGLQLSARVQEMYWTHELQEHKKSL